MFEANICKSYHLPLIVRTNVRKITKKLLINVNILIYSNILSYIYNCSIVRLIENNYLNMIVVH